MKTRLLPVTLSALIVVSGCHHETRIAPLPGTPNWQPDPDHATVLENDETNGNGIEVGTPKVYDDASLRMMLDATRAKLAGMSGLNQDALISRLGSVSGATINQTQFGFQITGSPLPGSVQTTNTGPTSSVVSNANLPEGNTSIPGTTTTTNAPTTSTVTTSGTPPAAPVVAPGIAFTPPGSMSPSSLDVLNEQMQLSYEMANLQLLLEGALSDRFVANQRFVKPRVTLGFPISLRTPEKFKDAVAVVEVTVRTAPKRDLAIEPPAITALLPREKTYNVAAMTDRTTSIGAGVLVGAVGASGSFFKGHKTLYLVQDQDTVAMQLPQDVKNPNTVSFLWEFRPVLGQHFVRGGMKQTFVQVALPVVQGLDCFGTIRIRTYWRDFDQKNGNVLGVIKGSVLRSTGTFPIPRFDQAPTVGLITYEDLGDGTVMVSVANDSPYLAGTYVQLGPARYDAGKNLIVEDAGLKFVAPVAALAQWTGHVVARSGQKSDLVQPGVEPPLQRLQGCPKDDSVPAPVPAPPPDPTCPGTLSINGAPVVQPLNEIESTVQVSYTATMNLQGEEVLLKSVRENSLLQIGGKVFGLKDAPVRRDPGGSTITATVPTALLISSPRVRLFLPFWSDVDSKGLRCFDTSYSLADQFGPDSASERLVLLSVDTNGNAVYLLYGNGLANAKLLLPDKGAKLAPVDNISPGRLQLLTIEKAAIQSSKKIVLQKENTQRPLLLDLPEAKPSSPKVSVDSPVIVNTNELDVSAEQAADVSAVKLDDKKLQYKPVDKSTIRLLNLKADGVTNEQKTRELTIEYKNGAKATLKFEVVAARIGVK